MGVARYVALLRGINVGGKNPVAMADLRAAMEADGHGTVRTYIQSGNVLFDTDAPTRSLQADIEASPWGQPIDPQRLLDAHPSPAVIPVVHAETSTGVRNEVAPLADRPDGTLLLGRLRHFPRGHPGGSRRVDGDIAYSGTQKCLGVPPGLAPLTCSERAVERIVERPTSWYFDLNTIARYVIGEGARAYHHTAPINPSVVKMPRTSRARAPMLRRTPISRVRSSTFVVMALASPTIHLRRAARGRPLRRRCHRRLPALRRAPRRR